MPYGDQRRLEIARALATDPQILLLDEPTAGMNPQGDRGRRCNLIFKIRDSGLAVVVIEHDMRFIFNLCDRVLCLVRGAAARRGHARRGAVRPPGHRGLHRWRRRGGGERVSAMLEVKDLEVAYGKIKAVKGITFDVDEGEVVTLIGTNGAGKTTTLRTISGLLRPVGRVDHLPGQGHHDGRRPTTSSSWGWRTPPRAGGSSPGSRSRRTCCLGAFARKDKARSTTDLEAAYDAVPHPRRAPRPSRPARSPVASSRCWRWAGR